MAVHFCGTKVFGGGFCHKVMILRNGCERTLILLSRSTFGFIQCCNFENLYYFTVCFWTNTTCIKDFSVTFNEGCCYHGNKYLRCMHLYGDFVMIELYDFGGNVNISNRHALIASWNLTISPSLLL